MQIELLSDSRYETLVELQKNHPIITYQNTGYDNFDKSKMTEEDKIAFDEVTAILDQHIKGFSSFQNFRYGKKSKELQLRFQYNYNYDSGGYFVGVGYITLRELKNGFDE